MLNQETRPLKRPTLGPPDLYAQRVEQKEDRLTYTSLNSGYTNELVCPDEHGTAKKDAIHGLSAFQVVAYMNGIIHKKTEFNTLSDASKKKPNVQKENFILVSATTKTKQYTEQWLTLLANGTKALSYLAKKVPIYLKKEEYLQNLYEFSVPNSSAAWYLKLAAAYTQTQNENRKAPRRHLNDPAQEWTQTITKYMGELLQKMIDYHGGGQSSVVPGFLTTGTQIDIDSVNKQWQYCDKLALHMYQEGLLDRQEYLNWAIDLLENSKFTDDNLLRVVLSLIFQYIKEVVKQYLLSRKLAQFCARKLLQMTTSSGYISPRSSSPHLDSSANNQQANTASQLSAMNMLGSIWADYKQCGQHRSVMYMACSMVQTVVLGCPSALVWLNLGEGKSSFIHSGSPLDLLPCHPCTLPVVAGDDSLEIRRTLRECEIEIARRSMAAELSWSSDKVQQSMTGLITGKLLCILDKLDRFNFDRADTSPAINQLYSEIMSIWNEKTSSEPFSSLEPLVFLLCDWAITTNRLGDHRPQIVARLLEKHQIELWNAADGEMEEGDTSVDKEEDNLFHNMLLKYLDRRAPVLDEDGRESSRRSFSNCVALYSELIRLDLFSHDVYVCTLISRGDLNNKPTPASLNSSSYGQLSQDRSSVSVLQGILESEDETSKMATDFATSSMETGAKSQDTKGSRHLQYLTHFPIPQDEQFVHECNQRSVVLFGVGKGRETSKQYLKKVGKDLQKLFSKKSSIDVVGVAESGKAKVRSDAEMDGLLKRFQSLAYYDQYSIASSTMDHILEMFECFISKTSTHVPFVEHIIFFFDLVESSHNITSLITFCQKLVVRMQSIEYRIREIEVETKQPMFVGKYTQHITVYCVGVLRCHLPSLLLDPQACLDLFQGMVQMVRELRVTAECSSAQRCILFFLFVLYQASRNVRESKTWAEFEQVTRQIQDLLCVSVTPAMSSGTWNKSFMVESFETFNMYKFRCDAIFSRRMVENRTSFVNNIMLYLCQLHTFERVNEVALMCSEFTAYCSHLSADWLGVLKALCCSSVSCGYTELLAILKVSHLSAQQSDNIAVFCAVLIARHCFSLYDFLQVSLLSLSRPVGEPGGESGARLTLQILLRVFKADTQLTSGISKRSEYIKSSCDLHLLAAANRSITINPLLAVLKAIFLLANTAKSKKKAREHDFVASLAEDITDEEEEDEEPESIGRHAKQVLSDICHEDWVREKFLLLDKEQLRDRRLESQGVWRLVQLICRRRSTAESEQDDIIDFSKQQAVIARILRSLDLWTIRVAWLELQLMHTCQNPSDIEGELSILLDNIARATIEVFHSYTGSEAEGSHDSQKEGVWLVAPLIAKLPTDVQERVLQSAALVLEKSNKLWQHPPHSSPSHQRQRDQEREKSMSLLNHQPFLALVLTCLKSHDEQREGMLSSLKSQLDKFVDCAVEDSLPTDPQQKQLMYEALQLRLSLVGGMFDTIQRTHLVTGEWAYTLNKLICYGIVDVQTNSELLFTVLDMLSALIHSTLVSDSADSVENSKRAYHTLIKKIKKDVGDKQSESLNLVRQLLPIPKHYVEVIACESHNSILDAKGNKIQGFESISKKSGLQVSNKYKISPWELIEGLKNPTPLCWQWFGTVKLERKALDPEEQHRLLVQHNHQMAKAPGSLDFLAPPPLPPEEIDTEIPEGSDESVAKASGSDTRARHLATSVPVPKVPVQKVPVKPSKRRTSRNNSAAKAAPYATIPSQPQFDNRMAAGSMAAAPGTWSAGARGTPQGYPSSYNIPASSGMVRHPAARPNVKETLDHHLRNRQAQSGMMMQHSQVPPQHAVGGYGIDAPSGSMYTKEQLTMFIKNKSGVGRGTRYEQNAPPQYTASAPFPNRMHSQNYMPQPPSYGAPTNPPQGGMMMSGGQQSHSSMMSYNAASQPMGRYAQGGQPAAQPPGGAYNTQYPQHYQSQQDSRMVHAPGPQYMQRGNSLPQQTQPGQPPSAQYTGNLPPQYGNY